MLQPTNQTRESIDMGHYFACLSPILRRGATHATAAANAHAVAGMIEDLQRDEPALRVALLPSGCISGGAGVAVAWPAGEHIAPLLAVAASRGVWIAGADCFDGKTFGFLISPAGKVELRQPLLGESADSRTACVVDTPCGRAALLVEGDALHPEYARLAMFAGAELLLNPCAERLDERSEARHMSRGARAWENHAIVAAASAGAALEADGQPAAAASGQRLVEIWSFSGQLLARGDAAAATASIDLPSLRQRRSEPWINFPAQLRTGVYAGIYAAAARGEIEVADPAVAASQAPAPYDVLMMQTHEVFVAGPEDRDTTIEGNLSRAFDLARLFCLRPTTRLLILPEFALQGSDGPHPHDYWERVGIRIPGPETEKIGAFARECNVYVCAMVFEYDPEWPLRYFNTSIIISPQGEVILRYRKLQCADLNGLLNITTPGSIFTRYVERYGYDALVPVVDTPIGRLGTLICYDSNWPELWRALAMKGAEVICNPTSEIHSDRRPHWYAARRAHAAEHRVYVASANAGSEQFRPGAPVTGMNRGHSALIDYNGMLASCADGPGVVPLLGRIDLGALRRARAHALQRPGVFQPEAVAEAYASFQGFPLDCFLDNPMIQPQEGPALVRAHIERLFERGVFARP
jgi:predicted amidohydrolase